MVNQVTDDVGGRCRACAARRRAERAVLAGLPSTLARRPIGFLPAQAREPHGLPRLRALARTLVTNGAAAARAAAWPGARRGAGSRRVGYRASEPAPAARPATPPPAPRPSGSRPSRRRARACSSSSARAESARRPARPPPRSPWPRRSPAAGRILLVSTDPAHSLGDVLGCDIGDRARRIPGAPPALWVREIDADRGFRLWRERYRAALEGVFGAGDHRSGGGSRLRSRGAPGSARADAPGPRRAVERADAARRAFSPAGARAALPSRRGGHRADRPCPADAGDARHRARVGPGGARDPPALPTHPPAGRGGSRSRRDLAGPAALPHAPARRAGDPRGGGGPAGTSPGTRDGAAAREPPRRAHRRLRPHHERGAPRGGGCARCTDRARAGRERAAGPSDARRPVEALVAPAVSPPPRGVAALEDWGRRWTRMAG